MIDYYYIYIKSVLGVLCQVSSYTMSVMRHCELYSLFNGSRRYRALRRIHILHTNIWEYSFVRVGSGQTELVTVFSKWHVAH
jgi:hypothetical protein